MQICHGNRISWSELLCQDQLLRWTIEILEFMTLNTCECYLINFKERGISYFPNCETLPFSFDKVFFCIPRISAFCDLGWVVKYKRWDLPDAPRCAANHWGNTFLANLPQIQNVSENFFKISKSPFLSSRWNVELWIWQLFYDQMIKAPAEDFNKIERETAKSISWLWM